MLFDNKTSLDKFAGIFYSQILYGCRSSVRLDGGKEIFILIHDIPVTICRLCTCVPR